MQDLVCIPVEKPVCPECHGTGKITLFRGIVDCKACKPKPILFDEASTRLRPAGIPIPEFRIRLHGNSRVDCKACAPQTETIVWKDEDIAKYLHATGVVRMHAYREREFYRRVFGDGCGF